MMILALDTTTFCGSVALLDNTRLISEINYDSTYTHSERLLRSIHFLLEMNNLEIKNIDGYAVAQGPGSFTGIRIGLSTVKSFSYASSAPIAPVSSLKSLAWKLRHPEGRLLCPVIDAKKGEVYTALFESKEMGLDELIAQGAYAPDSFFSRLPAHRLIFFIGNGVQVFKDKILAYFKDKARFPFRSPFIAYEVGLLGYEELRNKRGITSDELEPLYFRKSQAEERN